jgi:hypothetical protein
MVGRVLTELGLIRLISLVPGITMLLTPAWRPYRKAALREPFERADIGRAKAPPPPTLHLGSAEQCCLVSSGGGCGGKAVDRREGERQRMSRTQRGSGMSLKQRAYLSELDWAAKPRMPIASDLR